MQPTDRYPPRETRENELAASSPNTYSAPSQARSATPATQSAPSAITTPPQGSMGTSNRPVTGGQSGGNVPTPTPPPITNNQYQGGWNVPSIDNEVNRITNSDSLTMQQAKQQGMRNAGARGLLNSSIAGQASQQAAIQAATPIAQQNVQNQLQQQQFAQSVTANTQGQYMKATNDLINQALISINEIEKAHDISQEDKDKMIGNTIARRDEDLKFMKSFYGMMPTWSGNWVNFPTMPSAPGLK